MVASSATQPYGPNETQSGACDLAFSKAKQNALRTHLGETFLQQSIVECDSVRQEITGNDCELFETTWSSINSIGFIKSIKNKVETPDFSDTLKANICTVSAVFEIEKFKGVPDEGFETSVSILEGRTLRVTDAPKIKIASNRPAYHYVYYWAPYSDKENYYLLFPNDIDQQVDALSEMQIPSPNASVNYKLEVSLPEGLSYSNEYLVVYSSKQPLNNVPHKISESGLFRWLQSLDRSLWTQDKISYQIIGDSL